MADMLPPARYRIRSIGTLQERNARKLVLP